MTDTDIQRPGAAGRPQGDGTPLALAALLAGTLVGTVSNNVVNVPLPAILEEFDAPLSSGVFVVVGFLLTFTATMPLVGWIGDRFGRRRVYCVASRNHFFSNRRYCLDGPVVPFIIIIIIESFEFLLLVLRCLAKIPSIRHSEYTLLSFVCPKHITRGAVYVDSPIIHNLIKG